MLDEVDKLEFEQLTSFIWSLGNYMSEYKLVIPEIYFKNL